MAAEMPQPGLPLFSAPLTAAKRAEIQTALDGLQDAPASPTTVALDALLREHLTKRPKA
jgi:hypothetical protein